jgi:transcription termination/antitermination protein NusG
MENKWFVLFVAQGKEFYIKDRIENLTDLQGQIAEVLLPTTKEVSEVRRKKIIRNIPVYPCYLFINTSLINTNVKASIYDINYVVRFLGANDKPSTLRDQEVDIIRAISGDNKIRCSFQYKIGDMIEILGGHCKGLAGRVVDIPDVNNLKVEIQIFNRAIYTLIKLEDVKIA